MTNTYTMLHGDCMSLMSTMPEASYDAVITDPPYASGGLSTAARDRDPRVKYQLSGTRKYYPTFANDNRDQRTHLMWSVRWMEQALRLTRPGGWLMVFTDWRQLPLTSDALQIAGLLQITAAFQSTSSICGIPHIIRRIRLDHHD